MTTVYIIHGWTYNIGRWQTLVEKLAQNDIEAKLLRVPGLTTPTDKAWTIEDYVKWLHEQLIGVSKPIVIGHSNGGRIALAYLQKYSDGFGQLILIDSAGLAHSNFSHTVKLKVLYWLSKIGKPLARIPAVKQIFYKLIGARDYNQAPPHMRRTMQNMLNADKFIDISRVQVPTTIIWGRDDVTTPLKDGQEIHRLIAKSGLHIIDQARHSPQFTHTQQVADIITETVHANL